MYDILIQNGLLLDGSGAPGVSKQLAVKDGKIVRIAEEIFGDAALVIDAAGQVVTPGFIDSHSHSDGQFYTCPQQTEKIEQGITTTVSGQCGGSICSQTGTGFWQDAKTAPLGANMALLAGHGTIRQAVMGTDNREPTAQELEQMCKLLREQMDQGALGVSFGLIYVPGCYAKKPELLEMAKVVGEYGGIVAAHVRNEGDTAVEATAEFLDIIRESHTVGIHSHHKALGPKNWKKVETTLRMLDEAAEEGVQIFADVYPYIASHTKFSNAFVPIEWKADGVDALLKKIRDPENIAFMKKRYYARHKDMEWSLLTVCPGCQEYAGLRIPKIAELRGQDEFSAMLDIIELTRDSAMACFFSGSEEGVEYVMAHPKTMICTDAGVRAKPGNGYHPRLRGTFPRVLGRYVRQRQVTDLPEMIRKMTSLPAKVYGFDTKGLLKEGMDADICIFDPEKILDQAEFTDPSRKNLGVSYTIVGGKVAAIDGVATGQLGGRVLFRKN